MNQRTEAVDRDAAREVDERREADARAEGDDARAEGDEARAEGDEARAEGDEARAEGEEARIEAQRLRRHPRLKRFIARLCGCQEEQFVLQVVQPSLVGMIDGTVSTLAPIFAAAISSSSKTALLVGLATALGAGVSMGISEALSDTGEQTGRGSAIVRGAFTGGATTLGGVFHSLPFIISNVNSALVVAGAVVAVELFVIAWVRSRFLRVSMRSSLVVVTLGGALVLAIGVAVGSA